MKKKTILALAATGTGLSLIIGTVGVANAATTRPLHSANFVGGVGFNGVSPLTHVLSVLVANGTLTQAQSDAIVKEMTTERTAQNSVRVANQAEHQTLIATTIGSDWPTILKRLQAGDSLATIAGSKTNALIAALVAEETAEINKAVTDGRITAAQAATIQANVQARVTARVNATGPMGRMGGFNGGMGRGMGGGMGLRAGGAGGPGSNFGGFRS